MNPLLSRLASLRRWTRLLEGWRGVCALFVLVVGVATLAGMLDWALQLPGLVRAMVLVATLGGAGFVVYRYLATPFARPCDDLSLALRVEEHYPALNDSLASTVQFLQQPDGAGSVSMREHAIRTTLEKTQELDFRRILDTRGLYLLSAAAVLIAVTTGYLAWRYEDYARTAFWRLTEPFGRHTWTRVAIRVDNERRAHPADPDSPLRVAVGQPFVLRGRVEGVVPALAKVEIEGQTHTDKMVPIKHDSDGPGGSLALPLDMTMQRGTFRFRVLANDGTFPARPGSWQEVEVLPPPKLANLNGLPSPQIELHFPEYSDLPSPRKLTPGTHQIEALAGTNVVLRAAADRPLAEASIEYQPENPLVALTVLLSGLGQTQPLALVGQLMVGQAVLGRVPAQFDDAEQTRFTIAFRPWLSGTYTLHLQDESGLARRYVSDLHVLPDPVPVVKLQRPGTSSMTVLPDAEIGFHFLVEDEVVSGYRGAIRSVFIELRRKGADGNWGAEGPQRLVLYDAARFGQAIPALLAHAASSPALAAELRLRRPQLEVITRWPLHHRFKEGETVALQVCADDFCDVSVPREAGRSYEIELRIVGKFELAREVDEKLAEVQQQLVRLQKMQDDALKAVKEVQRKPKVTHKEVDQIIEAQQTQQQIHKRIGERPDEGLRHDLGKLHQLLRDNKLTDTEAQEKLGMLKGELDRLAQQELQQIEPQLAEARKDLAHAEQKEPAAKQTKDALEKAAKLQENAKKGLDELVKAMAPWASLQQIRAEARDIHSREQALKQELELLKDKKQNFDKFTDPTEKKQAQENIRDGMNKAAEQQDSLAKRMDDLVNTMREKQKERTKQKDDDAAKRLAAAAKIADEKFLPQNMRELAQKMKDQPHPKEEMIQKQEKQLADLEKVVDALEGKKQDVADRLKHKRKEADKEMERLTKKMKDLEQKLQDVNKIQNEQERLRKRKELAKEHEKLKEDLEKQARALARLQEQRASNDLNRAAEDVDKAAKKLEQGDNAAEEQRDAQEQLQQAKADLQESEEELAREELVKIADKLQGLKERQDAALERSGEFQKKILAKKFWADELADTLSGDAISERGLAKETQSLKENLKQAKVFEHILDRAAEAMEEAAKTMEERKLEGIDARGDPKLAELMKPEELENEGKLHEKTVRYQKQASRRLDNLLDAIKQELAKKDEKPKPEEKQPQQPEEQQGPKMRAADGIPHVAQLKALRAEQLDINELTKDFGARNPDPSQLTVEQQEELRQIQKDQSRLMELFQQIVSPAEDKGEQP
jgi:hypothetical protein